VNGADDLNAYIKNPGERIPFTRVRFDTTFVTE